MKFAFPVLALLIGWLLGSVFPLDLWPQSRCHRLGGAVEVMAGPGKPTQCVIPLDSN